MKKRFLIIILLLILVPFILNAQKGKITLGMHSGLNFSRINYTDDIYIPVFNNNFGILEDTKPSVKTSTLSGIQLRYYFSEKISIQSGINYLIKGLKYNNINDIYVNTGTSIEYNFSIKYYINSNFEYLQIPLLFQYTIGNKLSFTSSIGLSSYLLIGKYIELEENTLPFDLGVAPQTIEISDFLVSGIVGGAVSYQISEQVAFNLNLFYDHDFSNVFSYDDDEVYKFENTAGEKVEINPLGLDANSKFRSFSVSIGLAYCFN